MDTTLEVLKRAETGKGAARKARREGQLPAVLYGLGNSSSVLVSPRTVRKILLDEAARNKVYTLSGEGVQGKQAMIRDYQVDPVSRELVHVDLLEIDPDKKIQATVPLNFVGKCKGVAEGGVLNTIQREVSLWCKPSAIPAHVDIDVTALDIGDSLHEGDIPLPEGVELADETNATVVTVVPPAKEEEATPAAESAAPEVLTEKKPEGDAAKSGGDKK